MKIAGPVFVLCGLVAMSSVLASGRADAQEKPTLPKAKDKVEIIDYEGMLNDRLGHGVTPEKNAAA